MTRSIAEGAPSLVEAAKQHLVDQCFKIKLRANQTGPRTVPQAKRGGVLIAAAKFERVLALDPREFGRRVVILRWAGGQRIALNATGITIGHGTGVDRRHAEVGGGQRASINAQV